MFADRVLSGMRPTGGLHLGHYHGVLKNWVELQHQFECLFFVADWHALTTHYDTPEVIENPALFQMRVLRKQRFFPVDAAARFQKVIGETHSSYRYGTQPCGRTAGRVHDIGRDWHNELSLSGTGALTV